MINTLEKKALDRLIEREQKMIREQAEIEGKRKQVQRDMRICSNKLHDMTGKLRQLSNEREDDKLNEWMTSSHI